MAQLEDLANTAVSKSQIMDAFHPFVLAARRIMDQRAALSVPSGSAPADCESGPALALAPVIEPVAGSASSLAKEAITEVLSSAEGSNNPSFRILRKRLSTLPNHQANALSTAASDPLQEESALSAAQPSEAAPSFSSAFTAAAATDTSIMDPIMSDLGLK